MVPLLTRGLDPIQSVTLDDAVVVDVPLATNHVTTLSFPGPITALHGALISADPKNPAPFQLAHTKGSAFLSLRATEPGARANLNVRWKDRTYVFLLREGHEPVLSLNLVLSPQPVALPAPRLSATRLLGMLDKARSFSLLKEQHPAAVAGVQVHTFAGVTNATDYIHFQVHLEEVYRFNQEDTLVFKATLHNLSDSHLEYDPASLAVRVGERVYPQSVTDADGSIPPRARSVIHLAITGSPDGGRADLSLKNTFQILVTRTSPLPAIP